MENREAIKIINQYDMNFHWNDGEPIPAEQLAEAFDLAIAALEKQIPKRKLEKDQYNENLFTLRCPTCETLIGNYNKRSKSYSYSVYENIVTSADKRLILANHRRKVMDNKETINWLTRIRDRLMTTISKQYEALTIAIAALEFRERYDNFWEEVKAAGMKGEETEIHHSGRVFRIREVAQQERETQEKPFPLIVGQPAEMFVDGKWKKGKIVAGYRFNDGIVTIETENGRRLWCGQDRTDIYRPYQEDEA